MSSRRLWTAGALLVAIGWLVTPNPVPVYDGVGVPDEPYRFVSRPEGATATAEPTEGTGTTPVVKGLSSNGLIVTTSEVTPQLSLFIPPKALAATAGPIEVRVKAEAPTDQPPGKTIQANVYLVTITSPAGLVTATKEMGNASLFQRALDQSDGWVMHFRPSPGDAWQALETSRGGTDTHVASFKGAGQYALAKAPVVESGGVPLVAWLLGGGVALLVLLVVAIRKRSAPE